MEITINGLDELVQGAQDALNAFPDELSNALALTINDIQQAAVDFAPFRTGALRQSILPFMDSNTSGRITVGQPYGIFVEMGTNPHDILPINKKALMWDGASHPVKVVHHPGTAAEPFMEPAFEEGADIAQEYFQEAADNLMARMAT